MSIYVIMDGVVLHQLLDPNFEKNLPVIPSEVTSVNFTWKAGENRNYTYEFYELQSYNKDILNSPIISISANGLVPRKATIFEVLIPCVGNASGVATFTLGLRIFNLDAGQNLATIRLKLQKQCSYRGPDPECDKKCGKNGKCSRDTFQCVCATGIWPHCSPPSKALTSCLLVPNIRFSGQVLRICPLLPPVYEWRHLYCTGKMHVLTWLPGTAL